MTKNLIQRINGGFRTAKLVGVVIGAIALASCIPIVSTNYSPKVVSSPVKKVNEKSPYIYDADGVDFDNDKLTYSLLLAPPWLSINPTSGLISGTAPEVDADTPFDIEVGVSDGINPVVKQGYTLIVKNVQPSENIISGNLGVSASSGSSISGNAPLEDLVSLNGNGATIPIVKYEIGADLNGNGNLEDNEVIATSTSAIDNKKIIFTKAGTYPIYGRVTDSEGNTGISGPIGVSISSPVANPDLAEIMNFSSAYNVGDKFTYEGKLTNSSSQTITIDFSQGNSLECKLVREIIPGIGESILDEKFQNNLQITLDSLTGYLGLKQAKTGEVFNNQPISSDALVFTVANASVIWNGLDLGHTSEPFSYLKSHDADLFDKSGNYCVAIILNYLKGTEEKNLRSLSDFFVVN